MPFIFYPFGKIDHIIQIFSYTESCIDTSSYIDLVIWKCRESAREFNQKRMDIHVRGINSLIWFLCAKCPEERW